MHRTPLQQPSLAASILHVYVKALVTLEADMTLNVYV